MMQTAEFVVCSDIECSIQYRLGWCLSSLFQCDQSLSIPSEAHMFSRAVDQSEGDHHSMAQQMVSILHLPQTSFQHTIRDLRRSMEVCTNYQGRRQSVVILHIAHSSSFASHTYKPQYSDPGRWCCYDCFHYCRPGKQCCAGAGRRRCPHQPPSRRRHPQRRAGASHGGAEGTLPGIRRRAASGGGGELESTRFLMVLIQRLA